MSMQIAQFNAMPREQAQALLSGLYEHSDWIVAQALDDRPFKTLPALRQALRRVVDQAPMDAQLQLIRAHPALTGKAKIHEASLAADSRSEQSLVGLDRCSPEEYQALLELNTAYEKKFGWPFILAVRGPRGTGLTRTAIIAALRGRLEDSAEGERTECLRQIHRIAEMRLNERFGLESSEGDRLWDACAQLAQHSETLDGLTVTYLTAAHRACASELKRMFTHAGFDSVEIDAIGNVVGRYDAAQSNAKTLLTGSHYDTVRNGGRYDGRLGIVIPMEYVRSLSASGQRLPYAIELVAFAEEEGVRYSATFLGSSALTGSFNPSWLDLADTQGVRLKDALREAGLAYDAAQINRLKRDPARYIGFVEVHIEQGPVLAQKGVPLGVVTAINGSLRYRLRLQGQASHAGTTPMGQRRDAACAAAEIILKAEARASTQPDLVATVGMLQVPQGSINTVPGRCELSLDIRAPRNEDRDAMARDIFEAAKAVCRQRDVALTAEEVLSASAAPCDSRFQALWANAIQALGLPVVYLPSGAGHDAMKMHEVMPQAMLFVRGEHRGISHNPLESSTNEDMGLALEAFGHFCMQIAKEKDLHG